jgi:heme/copper-type cytochrome/quinol oxidase subunit 2
MKKRRYLIMILAITVVGLTVGSTSCKKEETRETTTITLDKSETGPHDIGETVTATVTVVAEQVSSLVYYKVMDQEKSDPVDVTSGLTQSGKTFTYNFSYMLEQGDDLGTLGFEFEVTDDMSEVKTSALLITTNLSVPGMFMKFDWKITAEEWLGEDVLADHDAAKIFRFNNDGTYNVDLSAEYAGYNHHFCYWVYKETQGNGDTLAELRLIRRLLSGDQGADEFYDFRITSANESEMIMYWDLAVWGLLDIQRTFKSQTKGAFQPYGTEAYADSVAMLTVLDCSNLDDSLLEW